MVISFSEAHVEPGSKSFQGQIAIKIDLIVTIKIFEHIMNNTFLLGMLFEKA